MLGVFVACVGDWSVQSIQGRLKCLLVVAEAGGEGAEGLTSVTLSFGQPGELACCRASKFREDHAVYTGVYTLT